MALPEREMIQRPNCNHEIMLEGPIGGARTGYILECSMCHRPFEIQETEGTKVRRGAVVRERFDLRGRDAALRRHGI